MKKRIVSIILAVIMIASVLPLGAISVLAESKEGTDVDSPEIAEAYGTYFTGDYTDSVFKITGTYSNGVHFNDITFENITCGENGACVYIDVSSKTILIGSTSHRLDPGNVTFTNCRFINCSTTADGGVVYIKNLTDTCSVIFENCVFINCHADGDGGVVCSNDADTKLYGNNTVISGCSAGVDGGAIYMELGKVIDGFAFADNDASTGNGGAVCNMSNSATVSNCRFYRNTCEDDGGAVYTEGEAVENCKFFGNDCSGRGHELYSYFGSTEINDCTFTSNYTDESAVVNGKQSNCAFLTEKDYTLSGNGSQNDPYLIKTTDDWDALHYMMLKRSRMSFSDGTEQIYGDEYNFYGKHFRLDDDITVYSTVGEAQYNKSFGIVGGPTYTLYHEFNGIFDGNGHTVTCYMYDDDEGEKAAFGYANSATVTNLTVDGYIRGTYSVGGIFGNAYNCTAEKCVNNATVYGVNDYVGGIAGYSAISEFDNCTNNGKVTAKGKRAGGIIGSADGASIRNCTVFGDVAAYIFAGGLIGYEANAVTAENNIIDCKVTGTASAARYPAEGDYVIYSASDPDFCFDIQDASNENGVYLRLRSPENCSANVFTLAYDVQNDCYTIAAKHSGRLLTVDVITASQDWASVYQYWVEDRLLARQRWIFESTGSENCCYIRSVSSFPQWYMNVANGDVIDGSYIIAYKNHGNDSFRLAPKSDQVMRPVLADAITGYRHADSKYEQCFYDKDKTDGSCGIGMSSDAMNGLAADENGNLMPYCINDYIKENGKEEDGWLRAAFDDKKTPEFIANGVPLAMGKHGLLHGFSGYPEVIVIDSADDPDVLGSAEKAEFGAPVNKTAYIVTESVTHKGRIKIVGDVLLIIGDGCEYTVNGGIDLSTYITSDYYKFDQEERTAVLSVTSLSLGDSMGKLTATSAECGTAAIGGNIGSVGNVTLDPYAHLEVSVHNGGNLNVFGCDITADGSCDNSVGIGGGAGIRRDFSSDIRTLQYGNDGGNGCTVNMYGGNLFVTAGKDAVAIGGGKGFDLENTYSSFAERRIGNGGTGGTFNCYGGTVTAISDISAFGKGIKADGNISDSTVADTKITATSSRDTFIRYGDSADDATTVLYKTAANAQGLNKNKYGAIFGHNEHQYTDKYVWADDFSTCTALRACILCSDDYPGHIAKSETVGTDFVHHDMTCTEDETLVYTSDDFVDPDFTKQTKTVCIKKAQGHSLKRHIEYDSDKREYIVADRCENCDYSTNESKFTVYDCLAAEKGAYINTGFKADHRSRVVMNVNVKGTTEYWFGAVDEDASHTDEGFLLGNNGTELFVGFRRSFSGLGNGSLVSNGRHTVEIDKGGEVIIDGVTVEDFGNEYTFSINYPLYLFANNNKGETVIPDGQGTVYCYGCEIYNGTALVSKFVPVKNENGASGLFDIVSGVFYANSGDATMTAFDEARDEVTIGTGDAADTLRISAGDTLPTGERVGSKYILGWTDKDGDPVTTYEPGKEIFPTYVETGMMKVKFQFNTPKDGKVAMRLIASVDTLDDYTATGWLFSLTESDPEKDKAGVQCRESNSVYNAITAEGKRLTVKDVYKDSVYIDSSNYLFCYDITNIPTSAWTSPIYVRPFVTLTDGTTVYGDTKAITIANYIK